MLKLTSRRPTGWIRSFSSIPEDAKPLSAGLMADVHGTVHGKKAWRNKPLFRREGDRKFRTGLEAAEMLYEETVRRDPYQADFLQASKIFLFSVSPVFDRYPKYAWVMKQLLEPERAIQFRVPWMDDEGNNRVNRGFRVQFSSSLGPYVGGLRFHPQTGHGTIKFLGLENILRNSLAGDYGGAAGGSDFNPANKSESEIMRFCQSFMTELANYIGPNSDIPGPGVGVGQAEIGYMFGQYKRIRQLHGAGVDGVIGGGQLWHPQIVGHGVAHFANIAITDQLKQSLDGKRCIISGSGMAALHTADKLIDLGAKIISLSDSSGYVIEPEGFTKEKLATLIKLKAERKARIGGYIMASTSAQFHPTAEGSIWDIPCDYAFPCALQNDITEEVASKLVKHGCKGVFEGANMACNIEALDIFKKNGVIYAPSKTCNAASLAVSGQVNKNTNTADLDKLIQKFMGEMYEEISKTAQMYNQKGDINAGANITAFTRVATAMLQQGAV